MFTRSKLDELFFNVSQCSGCKCSDIFEMEIFKTKVIISPGPEFAGKKTGENIARQIADYLYEDYEDFIQNYQPEIGKNSVEMKIQS